MTKPLSIEEKAKRKIERAQVRAVIRLEEKKQALTDEIDVVKRTEAGNKFLRFIGSSFAKFRKKV